MRIPDPNMALQFPGGLAYSNSEKSEALADNLESQFQPILVPLIQLNKVERVREEMETVALELASEHLLPNLTEIWKAMADLKVGKAPDFNGVPN